MSNKRENRQLDFLMTFDDNSELRGEMSDIRTSSKSFSSEIGI